MIKKPLSEARICLLGNSHLACLKTAFVADPGSVRGAQIDFFAASSERISTLRLTDAGILESADPATMNQIKSISAGDGRLDPMRYDAFALVGISMPHSYLLQFFKRNTLCRHRPLRPNSALVSDAYFTDMLADAYRLRPAYALARLLRQIRPTAPIFLLSPPCPTPGILDRAGYKGLRALRGSPYLAALAELYTEFASAAATASGAHLLPQRAETLVEPGFTQAKFNQRPIGLGTAKVVDVKNWFREKPGGDNLHMDTDFGRLRLADIADALEPALT